MLRITRITLRNFGPFKGSQSIDLPQKDGVTMIFGENMRGKTTLINAVRYALFGKVLSRGEHEMALHKIGNWEAAKDGEYGFKVVLEFDHDGQDYTLTRDCKPRSGVKEPKTDLDYSQTRYLKRGSDVLSPAECDATLARVMPEQVSRFFLFDGELLQQYEELLMNESEMGQDIKDAIERILGVPVLTWARYDMGELTKEAEKTESRTAQKDHRTRELGTQNAVQIEQRSAHEKELARLKKILATLKTRKSENEDLVRQNEKTKALLVELENLASRVKDIESKNNGRRERLATMASNAWCWVLKPELDALQEREQKAMAAIQGSAAQREISSQMADQIQQALSTSKCKVCGQGIDKMTAKLLRAQLDEIRASPQKNAAANLEDTVTRLKTLREIASNADGKEAALELLFNIEDGQVDRSKCQARIDEINEKTKDLDEGKLRRIMAAYDKTVQEIVIVDNGIKNEQEALKEIDENIKRIQVELERIGGADLTKERHRRQLCASLCELFDNGVVLYRERLRKKVENDASALFLNLTTEPEYASLKINDNYGLIIVHKDGDEIQVRSAGAEHVVALSLMGALQHNAPLEGPIVMDSPFGRLDEGHTSRIVKALPSMAKQVVLLVYESELEPKLVRNTLKGDLLREYKIVRKSARHSVLETSKD